MNLDWLKTLAPTVASALGGPLAGLAVTAIGGALGWSDAKQVDVTKMLESGKLTSEQISAIRIAETELRQHESDNGFKFAELEIRDRESARNMEIATKSITPSVLTWIIIACTLALEGFVLLSGLPTGTNEFVAGRILGTLDSMALTVIAFWFGTTKGSQNKDATIAAQASAKN